MDALEIGHLSLMPFPNNAAKEKLLLILKAFQHRALIFLPLLLCACVYSELAGPLPLGEDIFIISKKSVDCHLTSLRRAKSELSKEALKFCRSKEMNMVELEPQGSKIVSEICDIVQLSFHCGTAKLK